MAMARPEPYQNEDLTHPAEDNLDAMLRATVNGQKADGWLTELKVHMEKGTHPADSLAAAEDRFRREITTTTDTTDWN